MTSPKVNTKRAEYIESRNRVNKAIAIRGGEEKIKEGREKFLPVPSGMPTDDIIKEDGRIVNTYNDYLLRAPFFNATERTVAGVLGLVVGKSPEFEIEGDSYEDFYNNCDACGNDISQYFGNILDDLLWIGRAGTLVDYPEFEGKRTKHEAEQLNLRTRFVYYEDHKIINWKYIVVNNVKQLGLVVLEEKEPVEEDDFSHNEIDQWRVLILRNLDNRVVYVQEIWRRSKEKDGEFILHDTKIPLIGGASINYIPFVIHDANGDYKEYIKSPFDALMNVNIKHYQRAADHEHGLHEACLPTYYFFGVEDDKLPASKGPGNLWHSENHEAQAGIIQFEGRGLQDSATMLDSYLRQMAQLGARILMPEQGMSGKLTATGERMQKSGELSPIQFIVSLLNNEIQKLLKIVENWESYTEGKFLFSEDIMPETITIQDAVNLTTIWIQGGISKETLFYNFKKGGLHEEDTTFKEEEEKIDNGLSDNDFDSDGLEDAEDE